MKAFLDIRSEMREAIAAVTYPCAAHRHAPMQHEREAPEDDGSTNIEPWMATAFREILCARETDAPIALISCFMNGEPTAVIALTQEVGRRVHVMPLFVACTPSMKFSEHPPEPGGDGADE